MTTLEKLQKEYEDELAREPGPDAGEVAKEAAWLKSYARKKPVKNFGGNYWGINRNRCSIIKPKMIQALADAGHIELSGGQFTMKWLAESAGL